MLSVNESWLHFITDFILNVLFVLFSNLNNNTSVIIFPTANYISGHKDCFHNIQCNKKYDTQKNVQ
jgi:hypothetical protein